jgi:hypothetical protein
VWSPKQKAASVTFGLEKEGQLFQSGPQKVIQGG